MNPWYRFQQQEREGAAAGSPTESLDVILLQKPKTPYYLCIGIPISLLLTMG